jgi:2-methylisocitrate lyase-like PEP mutase family enzyme
MATDAEKEGREPMSRADRSVSATFREIHAPGRILILPNAWNAGSARVIEECGAAAVATTSSGLSWAHGYPDGNALPTKVLAAAVAEIARAVRVPLSADVEAGYSDDPARVAEVVAAVIDAGAVGINLEDGSGSPDLLCAKIEAAKGAAARASVDLFVNARTDVYLFGLASGQRAVEMTLERAARYRAAGCDGVFVPRLVDPDETRTIVAAIEPLPLNLLVTPGLAPAAELAALGVRRLSAGGAIALAALGTARRLVSAFLSDGRSETVLGQGAEYGAMNALFARP